MPLVTPKQSRAAATLSRILDSAEEIIEDEGVFHLTTGKVAEKANVSIGTVYRYFKNAEAIIDALAPGLEELVQDKFFEKRREQRSDVVLEEG